MGLLFLKYSRDNESQSDQLGVEYSTKVGYDAHEMADFFKTLKALSEGSGELPHFSLLIRILPTGMIKLIKRQKNGKPKTRGNL